MGLEPTSRGLKGVPTCAASAGSVLATCYSERTMLARGLVDQGGIAVPGMNLWPSTKSGDPESGKCATTIHGSQISARHSVNSRNLGDDPGRG